MDELIVKYLNNMLSQEELFLLRKETDLQSDEALEELMLEDWHDFVATQGSLVDVVPSDIGYRHEVQTSASDVYSLIFKIVGIAASLLVPLLLVSTFYFYKESTLIANQDVIIETGKGERVNMTLPDGTSIYINSETKLSYNPKTFNKKYRQVSFEGEAFFSVSHDDKAPFVIASDVMDLKVLGTKFNLRARKNQEDIIVNLLEGHVSLQSNISKDSQELFANESALFNKETGSFKVKQKCVDYAIAWTKGDLIFNNSKLEEVVKSIERNYNVKFEISSNRFKTDDIFTGTLPINNIFEVLEVLQKLYSVRCILYNNVITVQD